MTEKPTIEALEQRVKELELEVEKSKLTGKNLSSEDALLRAILDNMNLPVYLKSVDNRYLYVNRQYEGLANVTNQEINGKTDYDIFPEPVADLFRSQDEEVKKLKSLVKFTETIPLADGEHTFITSKFPLQDTEGHVYAIGGVCTDITANKRTEEALRRNEDFLNVVFDAIQDGLSVLDKDLTVVRVNKFMQELYSHMLPFEGKKKCYEVYHGRSKPCEICPTLRAIKSKRLEVDEVPLTTKDGVKGILELFSFPIIGESGDVTGVVEFVRDITKRKKIEEELLKVQKLESTGILAAGIAHDFNNLLMAILGNISLAKLYAKTDNQVIEKLNNAEKATSRAQDLTQQLLTFSKGGKPVRKPTFITELLRDSISFALSGSNVESDLSISNKLWPIMIDEGQISQVIQNVIKNAEQAMPDGGTVTIHAENKTIRGKDAQLLNDGKYVKITILDTGVGIQKKNILKVFDPYFSTNKKGSGLGLASAYSIIKNHGGIITVDSQWGKGTTFHIYLPISEEAPTLPKEPEEKSLSGSGRVLIMDDDKIVVEVGGEMLNFMGYTVEVAKDGSEAITLYKKAQNENKPFDAVILDLTIPGGMGGKETVKKLLKIDPKAKAIVSSGYANDPIMADFSSFGFSGVVAKPYNIQKLSDVLVKVLA